MSEYELLKLPRQETAHYFHNGISICGRSKMDLFSKALKWKEGMLVCRNCKAVMAMKQKNGN